MPFIKKHMFRLNDTVVVMVADMVMVLMVVVVAAVVVCGSGRGSLFCCDLGFRHRLIPRWKSAFPRKVTAHVNSG